MGRRPLLGAYVPPVAAVWMMRHIRGRDGSRSGLREVDVADAIAHFRSTGQPDAARAIEGAFAQLCEAERQWEQSRREDAISASGSAEMPDEDAVTASDRARGQQAEGPEVVGTTVAAGLLGCTDRRVRQLLDDGLLVGRKVGRQWLVDEASIAAMKANRRLTA